MAKQTRTEVRQLVIYQVFPRNHSEEGNFLGVIKDLPRIKAMGVDVLYLLPIHPIGEKNRKGDLGSPYAIKDYYAINEELGTLDDFKKLLKEAHKLGLRVMMDIVINHTAPDHPFTQTHPEYYYRKPDGNFGNKVGDWTDIIDLDYKNNDLWDEMINMLTYWTKLGVDGFRCDVASFVPIDFWLKARAAVEEINPNVIWLAESVHKEFLHYYRNQGYLAHSDSEVYQAFDICYDYDIQPEWMDFVQEKKSIEEYARMLLLQDCIYPMNYSKLRFLENHDQPRIQSLTKNEQLTKNWVAFSFFQKGTAFVYAGQETYATRQPNLFTKDLVDFSAIKQNYESLIKQLSNIKKRDIMINHKKYIVTACQESVMQVSYENHEEYLVGYFPLKQQIDESNAIAVEIPDNTYENQLSGDSVLIHHGILVLEGKPVILSVKKA